MPMLRPRSPARIPGTQYSIDRIGSGVKYYVPGTTPGLRAHNRLRKLPSSSEQLREGPRGIASMRPHAPPAGRENKPITFAAPIAIR